ncbi:MAG: flagellar hook-associated protein FlgK [Chloroflexota bacterium]
MANGWLGLNTALSGLRTAQQMLDISAHNIANVSTPGYSRQRAHLVAAPPFSFPAFNRSGLPGQLGTGVMISSIDRIRDVYLDQQINDQTALTGYWGARNDVLATAESVFPEPSNTGLGNELSKFWSSWEDLAANPSSSAARMAVLTQATSLAARFNRDASQLTTQISGVDSQVRGAIADANDLATQIAALNKQIQGIEISGDHANDLKDQRDQLVQQLNAIAPTQTVQQPDGTMTVLIGGTAIVDHENVMAMTAVNDASGHAVPTWSTGMTVDLKGGKLQAYIEARDVTLTGYMGKLNQLAQQIADQVNTAHQSGVDANGVAGLALFTYAPGSDASTLAVNAALGNDPSRVVVAASAGAPGDTSIASQIADLATSATFGTGAQTPTDAYASFIGQIGADAKQANEMQINQSLVQTELENRRSSISGVSLDEEATDVIRFQQAYQASAKVITTINEMLDTLINRMI